MSSKGTRLLTLTVFTMKNNAEDEDLWIFFHNAQALAGLCYWGLGV